MSIPWVTKILKAKRDRKDTKLLAAEKTTYIEVIAPSTNDFKILSFETFSTKGSPVIQKLSQERKMLKTWDQRQ